MGCGFVHPKWVYLTHVVYLNMSTLRSCPLCVEAGGVLEHAHGKQPREVNLGCALFQNIKAAFVGGFGVLNMWKVVNDLHERNS